MTLSKPTSGQNDWDTTLNAALDYLDTNTVKRSTRTPVVSSNTNIILELSDAGTLIVVTADENNYSQDFKVPANAAAAFPIGTVITFAVLNSSIWLQELYDETSDTSPNLYGEGYSGTNWMGFNGTGVVRLIKLTTNDWILSGSNILWD